MNFFVWHGAVYATDGTHAYVLDTRGYDEPMYWAWQALPEQVFETVKQQYQADNYRGPG